MQWCFVSEMKPQYCVLFRKPAVRAVADAPSLRIIPAQKFHQIRMHSSFKRHPYSEKFVVRDYFPEAKASLFGKIRRQGLFSRGESIPIRKNSSPGIIFPRRMHPYSEKFVARDYFPETNASLFGKFRRQGLFSRGECIPIRKNSSPGIIFPRRMHPYSEKFAARDYFPETNASLFGKFRRQGLFSRGECIPIRKISPPRIIVPWKMHP